MAFESKSEVQPEMDDLMPFQKHAFQFEPNQYPKIERKIFR